LISGFVSGVRDAAAANASLLRELRTSGLRLGVVSNGCGNVAVLCDDLGYSPYLSVVVDSHRVGVSKPDPAIFVCAAAALERRGGASACANPAERPSPWSPWRAAR